MTNLILSLLFLISVNIYSQENYYAEPLKIPLLLTGSFAELRSNHFHSGIDFRTEGKTGIPVHSVANGYISRIVVSPTGFGNALYIDHPNGTTSVYGHLLSFNERITTYIKNLQYRKKSFRTDVNIPKGKFKILKNEIIGLSGNSGSSGGPHLHFEIRDTKSQEPLNPLDFKFNIKDDIKPNIINLMIYPLDQKSHVNFSIKSKNYTTVYYNGAYHIKNAHTIPVYGKIGFGIQAVDYLNGTWSKCGINFLKVLIDGNEIFAFEINKFSFSETRYLNSVIDYENYIDSRKRYYKTWKDPGNQLKIYSGENDGIYIANDEKTHSVEIIVEDSYKNRSVLKFKIKSSFKSLTSHKKKGFQIFNFDSQNIFEAYGIKLNCPRGAFYTDFDFEYSTSIKNTDSTLFSEIHKVHHKHTPVHKPIVLSIKPDNLPKELKDKALIASIDEQTGQKSSFGGSFNDGYIVTRLRSFGNFAVTIDTIPPTISSLSIKNKKTLTDSNKIRFKIKDQLSGIKKYEGTIDKKWVLFEYDAKNNLLTYVFDKKRMEFNRSHNIKLEVTDNKNNISVYEGSFYK